MNDVSKNLNSIFFYKGDIHDFDDFFINHKKYVYELTNDFNNKINTLRGTMNIKTYIGKDEYVFNIINN